MVAVVGEGDLAEEAVGGSRLPREVGRRVWHARSPVLGVQALADSMAEVLRPLLRDLGQVPHALAAALGSTMAQVVRARQAVRAGYPHVEPIVEVVKPGQQRLLGGLVITRPGGLAVWIAEGIPLIPGVRPDLPVLDCLTGQYRAVGPGQGLARHLPPKGKVLRGRGAPELPAAGPVVLHDARFQPPEVGFKHGALVVAHQPRRELLGEAKMDDRRERAARGPGC